MKSIIFKHGADDFSFWQVEVAENDMKQFYARGYNTSGSLDKVLDSIKDFERYPNMVHFYYFNDNSMTVWAVESKQEFLEKYCNEGSSIRGTRKDIQNYIAEYTAEYTEKVVEIVLNQYHGIEDGHIPGNPVVVEKPSVLQQIRGIEKKTREPHKDKPTKSRKEQEI